MCRLVVILVVLILSGGVWTDRSYADATHVQKCQSAVGTSVSSVNCSLTGVTAGNAIVAGVYWSHASNTFDSITVTTCTGAFTLYNNPTTASGTGKGATGADLSIGVGGNCTFTANFSGVVSEAKIWVHEVGGVSGGSVAGNLSDTDAFRNTTCTDCIPDVAGQLAITPTVNGAYFFGLSASIGSPALSPGTDFTDGATDDLRGTAEYYIQPTAASHATTFSRTDTTGGTAAVFALVLQPAATGTTNFLRRRQQ